MSGTLLDPRLEKDTHLLGSLDTTQLLLMRNALFPWFVLVPETDEIEFYKLDPKIQVQLLDQINLLAEFIESHYPIEKMSIGLIGNMVSQLHVHLVGRNRKDICWPDVVWGVKEFKPYQPGEVEKTVEKLVQAMRERFRARPESS